jgi:hypothetical protein
MRLRSRAVPAAELSFFRYGSRAPDQLEGEQVRSSPDRVSFVARRKIGIVGQQETLQLLSNG